MSNVAVLIATYNGEKYLAQQLDSCVNQTIACVWGGYTLYIHDDGSTDGTKNVIRLYKERYPNIIKDFQAKPSGGAMYNFYYLLQTVEAEYYFFCDQDDVWVDNKVQVMLDKLLSCENGNKPTFAFCDLKVVDENLRPISPSYLEYTGRENKDFSVTSLIFRNYAPGCSVVINRALRNLMISVDDFHGTVMHDWWGMLLAECFGDILFVDQALVSYRQHSSNEMGAVKYYSLKKVRSLLSKRKNIRKNLVQSEALCNKVLNVCGNAHMEVPEEINSFLAARKSNKYQRIKYYLNNRKCFTKSALISLLAFG